MTKETYGAPGGAHSLSIVKTTVAEATDHALELRAKKSIHRGLSRLARAAAS